MDILNYLLLGFSYPYGIHTLFDKPINYSEDLHLLKNCIILYDSLNGGLWPLNKLIKSDYLLLFIIPRATIEIRLDQVQSHRKRRVNNRSMKEWECIRDDMLVTLLIANQGA